MLLCSRRANVMLGQTISIHGISCILYGVLPTALVLLVVLIAAHASSPSIAPRSDHRCITQSHPLQIHRVKDYHACNGMCRPGSSTCLFSTMAYQVGMLFRLLICHVPSVTGVRHLQFLLEGSSHTHGTGRINEWLAPKDSSLSLTSAV